MSPLPDSSARRGLWLGFLGVAIFAVTLPATRLALADLSAGFIALGRAAVAGLLAILYLRAVSAAWPSAAQWRGLALVAIGVVFGFPVCSTLALRYMPAGHAAIVTGLLPLATAWMGCWWNGDRPSTGFWLCAVLGSVLVMGHAWAQAGHADLAAPALVLSTTAPAAIAQSWIGLAWMLAAITLGALGYAAGARLSQQLDGPQVISWALILSLPITLPLGWYTAPESLSAIATSSWLGFAYVSVMSMFIGFFFWYRGLALGGTARVSQIQLLQPFMSVLIAWPLVGEPIHLGTIVTALAVMACVALGRKMPVRHADISGPR